MEHRTYLIDNKGDHSPWSRMSHSFLRILSLFVLAVGAASCSTGGGATTERIIQRVDVDAPTPPKLCDDPERPATIAPRDAAMVIYLFTEEYCDACARELAELDANAQKLRDNNVLVLQAVTQTSGSCFNAARLARKSPWPYAAVDSDTERNWALRSTPTLWLVNPRNGKTIAYVEGEITATELLQFIP